MAILRRLVFSALCAGLLSGVFATAVHQIATVPIILQAETYEKAAERATTDEHAHSVAWEPEDGLERTAYTLLADILTGTGFALLLAAGLTLRGGDVTWREGLLWGLAGFATFTIAPGIGLPPEIPGTASAPLFARQLWWLAAAITTGCGLALLFLTRRASLAVAAAVLIVLPHLYGAPRPPVHANAAPEELARQFVVAVTVTNFVFWLILGASTGYFYKRFRPRDARFSDPKVAAIV
jgi:cobalt transporter subunit CbtA